MLPRTPVQLVTVSASDLDLIAVDSGWACIRRAFQDTRRSLELTMETLRFPGGWGYRRRTAGQAFEVAELVKTVDRPPLNAPAHPSHRTVRLRLHIDAQPDTVSGACSANLVRRHPPHTCFDIR